MDVPPSDLALMTTSGVTRVMSDSPVPHVPSVPSKDVEELDSFDPLEPPPLDWRSDSSSEEEDLAADNLTDFTDSLDKASPNTPMPFPADATNNVEQKNVESVKNSKVLENVDSVYAANSCKNLATDLDKQEASNVNNQDASGSEKSATQLEEHCFDVPENGSTNKSFENVCAENLDKNLSCNLDKEEASNFNQQDANAKQERVTNLEEHSLDVQDDRPANNIFENVSAENLDKELVCDLDKEDRYEAYNCKQKHANASQEHATNLGGRSILQFHQSTTVMEDAFQEHTELQDLNQDFKFADDKAISKREVSKIMEIVGYAANEHKQPAIMDHLIFGSFECDVMQIGKNEAAFEGKEHCQVRNPALSNTREEGGEYIEDEDHSRIQSLLSQLQVRGEEHRDHPSWSTPPQDRQLEARHPSTDTDETTGLLHTEDHECHMVELQHCTELLQSRAEEVDAVVFVSYSQEDTHRYWGRKAPAPLAQREDSFSSQPDDEEPEPVWMKLGEGPPDLEAVASTNDADDQPSYKDVPGPCDPEDLLDGVIFGAKYLGSTQLRSDRTPSTNARMAQAQEAVDRIKAPEGETQPMTEVDLFMSTKRIKVLTADTQEAMMDHPLQMISYIADIGEIVVLMARRKRKGPEAETQKKCLMICHVFTSEDAQVIAQAIGQAFGVAYQQFLQVNGIRASELRPGEYSHYLESQELYNGDLAHFSDAHNLKEVAITKPPGEMLGLAVVESGWGSILPTLVVANMLHGGPAERCGELSIGDRIMSVNGTSLVGLPIHTCQNIIRDLKSQKYVKLSIVHCPPVTMAIIRRPDPKYQLGFSVEDGIICSLMRGGIAERGGIRVGHRIIEINGQSVVATTHDKIIQTLTNAVGEIHLKTMPASTYRLLTGQEQPVYL